MDSYLNLCVYKNSLQEKIKSKKIAVKKITFSLVVPTICGILAAETTFRNLSYIDKSNQKLKI